MSLLDIAKRLTVLASKDPCSKCGGTGNIPQFGHVDEGICYWCKGTGVEPAGRRKSKSTVGPATPIEEQIKMTVYELRTQYSNLRNALRSLSRGDVGDMESMDEFWLRYVDGYDPKEGKAVFVQTIKDLVEDLHKWGEAEKAKEIVKSFADLMQRAKKSSRS